MVVLYLEELSRTQLLKVQICFSVFLNFYACFENMPKEFYRSRRLRQKYLSYSLVALKAFQRTQRYRQYWSGFYLYKVISEYATSILACTENTHINMLEYLPYMENTLIKLCLSWRIFDPKPQ